MSRVPLTFRIFKGNQLVREETLSQGVIKIGKVQSAHLRIDDESVSRMHAILEVDTSGSVHIIDLGSTRGTFVNGQKVNKARLHSGDSMQFGDLRVELTIGAMPVAAPAPIAVPPPVPMAAHVPPPVPMAAPSYVPPPVPRAVAPVTAPPALYGAVPQEAHDDTNAKAIEVAAMLGDSIVDVKHCIDPRSGKVSKRTWSMFAIGAASVLTSVVAFYVSVHNAAVNKAALDHWTHVLKRPSFGFRPEMLSTGFDFLAFGGFALGLITLATALVRLRREQTSPYYTIGTAPGVELPLETAPAPAFPLVAPQGDDFIFNYAPGIEGDMIVDGKSTPLAELAATGRARPSFTQAGAFELPIPMRARIRARSGQTTFVVTAVAQPRRQASPLLAGLESRTMSYFAGSLAAHLGIWALLQLQPIEGGGATFDTAHVEDTTGRIASAENEITPPEIEQDKGTNGDNSGAAQAMRLDEGAAGTTKSDRTDSHMRMANNNADVQLARLQAMEAARSAGILGVLGAQNGDYFASLDSMEAFSSGFDTDNVYGQFGAEGEGKGYFGYGRNGFGAGGGCNLPPELCGTVGSGGFGKIGFDGRAGNGWGLPGRGGGDGRAHNPLVPKPIIGEARTEGDLDKSIIRRYIMRSRTKIAFCYEHELMAKPGIGGEITVQFFITPTGSVQKSTGSGFDQNVATCVAEVISFIEFPKPNGGGVLVNYPFTFRPTAN